jgi:hypothetical protein
MPLIFSVCFTIHLKVAQHEAKEKLEASMLQTLHLKKEEFSWYKKGKEIRIGKHLFDVKSITEENGILVIAGLYDEQEDLLHKQLEQSQNKQENSSENNLCNFFFHFYYSIPSGNSIEPLASAIKNDYPAFNLAALLTPARNIISPPPNNCLIYSTI